MVRIKSMAEMSDYMYHFAMHNGIRVLVIIDLDKGRMSVTNNVENVVTAIADEVGEDILCNPIVYRDSDGIFDGIDGVRLADPFYPIRTVDRDTAVRKAAEKFLKQQPTS